MLRRTGSIIIVYNAKEFKWPSFLNRILMESEPAAVSSIDDWFKKWKIGSEVKISIQDAEKALSEIEALVENCWKRKKEK